MNRFSLSDQYRKYYRSFEPILAKPKTKVYSTVIFFFLVVSLFGWYAIKPTIQTILYLQREIVDKTEVDKKMDEKINALIEAQAALEDIQNNISIIDEVIPPNPQAVDLARQLNQLALINTASVSAIQISSVPILSSTASAKIKTLGVKHATFPVTVSLEGSYANLSGFLTGLIDMRRIVTIDSIMFSPKKTGKVGTSAFTLQLLLKLTAYYVL